MPCLLAILGFFFPRLIILLLAVFTDYLHHPYHTILWPVLGFFFLPLTTLAYAWGVNAGGIDQPLHVVVLVLAVLFDLGVVGGGARARRRRG